MGGSQMSQQSNETMVEPIETLMEEHKIIVGNLEELGRIVARVGAVRSAKELKEDIGRLKAISKLLLDTEPHHQREERVLFPRLEQMGIAGPPRVMIAEHVELRARKHKLAELLGEVDEMDFKKWAAGIIEAGDYIVQNLESHIHKEDTVLYPMAVRVFPPGEWATVSREFDEIGYCPFTPGRGGK